MYIKNTKEHRANKETASKETSSSQVSVKSLLPKMATQAIVPTEIPPHEKGSSGIPEEPSGEWSATLSRTARCIPCDESPKIPTLNPHTHINKYVLLGDGRFAVCTCEGTVADPNCEAICPGDPSTREKSWRYYGCACDECSDCNVHRDYFSCECDCGIPNFTSEDGTKIPAFLKKPSVIVIHDGDNYVVPSTLGGVEEKEEVRKLVSWPVCANPECACTSTYNGKEGKYCSNSCKKGSPKAHNKHRFPPPIQCGHCDEFVHKIGPHLSRCSKNPKRNSRGGSRR